MNALFGGVLFIDIFLSIIFMIGIYYKQISEGLWGSWATLSSYKKEAGPKQIKQTINKQVLTVFFLPVIFASFILAFAYHMLKLDS